ncbi:hypothetical protein ACFYTQ_05465 [Nocardia sp. NPDC004068]|uniref:hypothetical protein n=1 Tax=Nocardia sp. NPDC004068 TaxID=3364303 RepID=UPI0036B183BF
MTLTYPTDHLLAEPPIGVPCRQVQLLAAVEDPTGWQARIDRLLAAGDRRWRGRGDSETREFLRRWRQTPLPPTPYGHPTLPGALAAAAAGRRVPGAALTDFATAVMLLSGCPTVGTVFDPAPVASPPRVITVTLFALPGDDLTLAEDLAEVTITGAGVVAFRCETTVLLAGERAEFGERVIRSSPDCAPG